MSNFTYFSMMIFIFCLCAVIKDIVIKCFPRLNEYSKRTHFICVLLLFMFLQKIMLK